MSIKAVISLAEILGKDRPEVKRMIRTAQRHPEKAHIIHRHMLLRLQQSGYDTTDLPVFSLDLPENLPKDGIPVGDILKGTKIMGELCVPLHSYGEHTAVFGHSGSGKSFLILMQLPRFIKVGIFPWVFDNENEYRVLLKLINPNNLIILNPKNDRDNFLEPPAGVSPKDWVAKLKNLFREVFFVRDGVTNLLDNFLFNLYKNKGVMDGGKDYPCLQDLLRLIDEIEFKPGTRFSGYHESLVNRVRGLEGELGDTLNCKTGYGIAELSRRMVIFETGGLSDYMRNFYVNLKVMRLASFYESLPFNGLKTIVVIEEAHKLFNAKSNRYDLGEPMIFGKARTLRKAGIGCIYSDQVPSELPAALSGNVNNHFVMRLVNGKDIWRASQTLNLNQDEAEFLPVIPKRQCIFQSADYPRPVLFQIPELSFEPVAQDEVDCHMNGILPTLEYTPMPETLAPNSENEEAQRLPGEKKRSVRGRPNRIWTEIAKILAEVGYISLTDLYANLGNLAPWHARKIIKSMEGQDMIELCSISLGTRGNPKTYVVLRQNGSEFIRVGFDDVRLRGKGSTEHAILQNMLAEAMKDSGKTVEIECSVNGKSADITEIGDEKSIAYEIELAPSHPHVVENVHRDLDAGFHEVVVITRNQAGQNEAKDVIYRNLQWEAISRVRFKLIREFF